ncbi:MAG: DUF2207 domain-containing protein [Actinomycetota bacterium]
MIRRVMVMLVLGLVIVVPNLPQESSSVAQSAEETSITSYEAIFEVSADGELSVVEKLDVNFPASGKRGIFRFFDVRDPNESGARRTPRGIAVTRDGEPDELDITQRDNDRYWVARIGSPSITLEPGIHRYEIRYQIDDVLLDGGGQRSRFYWNLIGGGWTQAIDKATLTVRLPATPQEVRCAVGAGATGGCTVTPTASKNEVRIETATLPPRTPVTMQTDLALAPPDVSHVPWPQQADQILGTSWVALVLVVFFALLAGWGGARVGRSVRESDPGFPLQYAPPAGIGPAQAAFLRTEKITKEAFVGSAMYAAERGAIHLEHTADGTWTLTDQTGPQGWHGLDEVTMEVAGLLSGPSSAFIADGTNVAAGKALKSRMEFHDTTTRSWAHREKLLSWSQSGWVGRAAVTMAAIVAVYLGFWNPIDMSMAALIPGLFVVGGVPTWLTGATTRRTTAGRHLWSQVGGFHRVLSTPSSVARFDFAGRENLYTTYLPWAVAFGCAEAWAEKYRTDMAVEPPNPTYIGGYSIASGAAFASGVNTLVSDFSATVDATISAYQATQTSSSGGGGGGFSGGGGGGGGGGGSW